MHEHADFGVFVRGDKLDFNQEQFLSTEDVERSENVHVHAPRTNVAHVHREQTTWDEFFVSLGMEITDECLILADEQRLCESPIEPLRFVVNGVEVDTIRFQSLSDLDRVAIIFGSDETASRQLAATVSDEACIPSESCKNRIDPNNPEKEPCRKSESACH